MTGRPIAHDEAQRRLDAVLRALDWLAVAGNNGARHAAAVLRGHRKSGRRPINDDALLLEVDEQERAGRGAASIGSVARTNGKTPAEVATIARRLRRKRRLAKIRTE